ncbi:MAG TPA: hypothetical protein HA277_03445 [Methanosphaera sp.]|nr:hypothetical protein [Methanosphaera sp.]
MFIGGDFINKFFKDIFNKGNFKDYFNRNKIFITVSIAILLLSLWSGFTSYSRYAHILANVGQLYFVSGNPLSVFEGSLIYKIIVILAGFTFSIVSLLLTVFHGVSVGYLSVTQNFLVTYLPQGIFDLLSQVFAMVGAFLVTKIEVRLISILINRKFDTIYSRIKVPLKDLVLTLVFIIILSIIALIIGIII